MSYRVKVSWSSPRTRVHLEGRWWLPTTRLPGSSPRQTSRGPSVSVGHGRVRIEHINVLELRMALDVLHLAGRRQRGSMQGLRVDG